MKERRYLIMLSLEIIGVLGALFGLLVYSMVKTQLARRRLRQAEDKANERASAVPDEVRWTIADVSQVGPPQ